MEVNLREWQKQKFNEALNGLKEKKSLLLNVNTGAGKTFFVLLLGKTLHKKILFLTRTHSEFEAVKREAERLGLKITYLFGKNAVCPFATEDVKPDEIECRVCSLRNKIKDLSGLKPSEILQKSKEASDYCPYYSLRSSMTEADIITASYLYFFNPVLRKTIICDSQGCLKPQELLVIVDEAHNLISADEWFTIKIGKRSISNALNELETVARNADTDLRDANAFIKELGSFLEKISNVDGCRELPLYPKPSIDVLSQIQKAALAYLNMIKGPIKKSSLRSIYHFFNTDGEMFNCNGSLTLVPSNAYDIVKRAFSFSDMRLLMSGTLPDLGIDGYMIKTKVNLGKAEYYYCDSIDSKMRNRKINAPKYADIIKQVYAKATSNVLVFFPSYDFKDEVRQYLTGVPILEENKRITHEEILQLMQNKKYAVLLVMRAKESEGVEFRGRDNKNLFNDIVLAGLPYPDISDALMKKRIRKFAELTNKSVEEVSREITLITVKQTIGRSLRSENDIVNIYLCDSRYKDYLLNLELTPSDVKKICL